ncbi:MAG: hypothetical protein J1E60_00820 [Christensenellaceae bacterium]|nr:hypothetical protein [Christensenellaceae bacterium]
MQTYSIITYDYDVNMEKLLIRRLRKQEFEPEIDSSESKKRVTITISDDECLVKLSNALSELILIDLRHLEIARIANALPFTREEKRKLLPRALKSSIQYSDYSKTAKELYDYLTENDILIVEGYMRFRMQDVMETWSVCVDTAAEEQLLHEEYMELMRLLGMFTELRAPATGAVTIIMHPDGSSTITDENEVRIDCAQGNDGGVLSMLIGMAPEKIYIYDLSRGRNSNLKESIKTLFGSRVSCYS